MVFRLLIFLLLTFSVLPVEGKTTVNLSHPMLLIIDTDADMDDMMAILYLLKSPRVDVKAITTVGDGMTRWEYGAKNILNLLELAGRSHVPVSYGARKSLSPAGSFPAEWRNAADETMGIKLPKNPVQPVTLKSPELMADVIKKSPLKINILCLGPLTNLAIALAKYPDIKDNIERVYIMGGAILVPGNIVGRPQGFRNRVAEYNIFLDAKAATDVFASGLPITLVPLDATEHVPVTKKFFERISKDRKTPSANFVYEVIKPFMQSQKRLQTYFWDPATAVIMTHPEIGAYRKLNLTINLRKGPEYARVMMTKHGDPIRVVTGIDPAPFYDIFLKTLNRPTNLKQNPSESR